MEQRLQEIQQIDKEKQFNCSPVSIGTRNKHLLVRTDWAATVGEGHAKEESQVVAIEGQEGGVASRVSPPG